MNDSCFKAKKEFDKAKQEFVKFPVESNNFYKYQKTVLFAYQKKPLGNINGTFTKLLTSEINKRFICSSGQLSNPHREILLAINQTVIIQTPGNLILKSHYCDVIDKSQTF